MRYEHGDMCHLCHHPGALTADHVTTRKDGGLDLAGNYLPAHGTGNPCPTCGRLCNQERGSKPITAPPYTSRDW